MTIVTVVTVILGVSQTPSPSSRPSRQLRRRESGLQVPEAPGEPQGLWAAEQHRENVLLATPGLLRQEPGKPGGSLRRRSPVGDPTVLCRLRMKVP